MNINLIVAVSKNKVIGKNNKLPWRCPSDLKRFKNLTKGHHILMGRKTFDSLPGILPFRTHLVVTKQSDMLNATDNVIYFNNIKDAVEFANLNNEEELFIIGGQQIFDQTIHNCNKLYVTLIDTIIKNGDSFFNHTLEDFVLTSKEDIYKEEMGDDFNSEFLVYESL